ncbi:MAG: sugar-binding transcriptional regulator [Pelolinea sp.]|nr:sugar-binding transcriptional regulator [Pelolinea sp.]
MARTQSVDYRLLQKVARLYYENDQTQQEISSLLKISRPKVSRLLTQAKDFGIVKITISGVPGIHTDIETALEKKYGIDEVYIVEVSDPYSQIAVSKEIGVAAAEYFTRVVTKPSMIGISWGTTLRAMADAIPNMDYRDCELIQVLGGLGLPESRAHATYILRRMVTQIGSKLHLLNLPGILDHASIRKAILSESYVKETYDLFKRLDIVFIGLGAPTPDSVLMRDGTILSEDELKMLLEKGVVGDIALRFLDKNGNIVLTEIDNRVIGISLEELKEIKQVVGLAGGPEKVNIVRAALRGKFINHLITDHLTGEKLLRD